MVEAADRLLARSVAPVVSEFYRRAHQRRGVDGAARLRRRGPCTRGGRAGSPAVLLADGTALPADLVLVGVGVEPRTELAEQLGLACAGGIVVDAGARTSAPGVVAAGDCTVAPAPADRRSAAGPAGVGAERGRTRPRSPRPRWPGQPGADAEVPWFWSDQYDLKLQIAGLAAGLRRSTWCAATRTTERFSVLYYRDGVAAGGGRGERAWPTT